MTLDEIRAMNPNEARKLRLEDVLKAVYEGETYTANDYRFEDEHHNPIEQGWEVRNADDGNLVSRHRIQWTYHEPAKEGRVKDIDVQGGNILKRISHDRTGKILGTRQFVVAEETIGDRIFESAAGGLSGATSGVGGAVKRLLGWGS